MKRTWKNGDFKVRSEKQPMFVDYQEHKLAEENLKNYIAKQRHQLFTVRRLREWKPGLRYTLIM